MPTTPARVYVHIGPPKTGTTYLQAVLRHNASRLAEVGVRLPRDGRSGHFIAALDLRDMSFQGYQKPHQRGAWSRLVGAVDTSPGAISVISHEILAGASSAEVARLTHDLAPAEVHVIYGARDVARVLPAVWQESIKNRGRRQYEKFLRAALLHLANGRTESGVWRAQHQPSTLARWAMHVPPDRIHVVTIPQQGGGAEVLWQRFCEAIGIDPEGFDLDVGTSNVSLSAEETEVLRLINENLPRDLSWPDYERRIKRWFNDRANAGRSTGTRLTVPRRHRGVLIDHTTLVKKQLTEAGYRIVGSLDDLDPAESSFGPPIRFRGGGVSRSASQLLADVLMHRGAVPQPAPRWLPQRAKRVVHRMVGRWR